MTNLPKNNMQTSAWECPRCGRMNAPFNPSCFCKKDEKKDMWDAYINAVKKPLYDFDQVSEYIKNSRCDNCGGHHGIFQGRAVQCINLGANGGT